MDNLTNLYKSAFTELIKLVDMCAKFDIDETNIIANQHIEKICQDHFHLSYREVLAKVYTDEDIVNLNKLKLKKFIKG